MARQVPGTLPTAIVSAALGIVLAAGCVWAAGPWSGGQRVSERGGRSRVADKPVAQASQDSVAPSSPAPSTRSAGPTHAPAGAALLPVLAGDKPGGALTAAELASALGPLTLAPGLGKHVGIAVADPASDALLFDDHAAGSFAPASTNKVVTAVAALAALGPDEQFTTRVVQGPNSGSGSAATASIVLVGGGDPTLSTQGPSSDPGYRPASLDDLAARTAAALQAKGVNSVTLGYDASVFGGPALNPTWSPGYTDGNVAPVVGLMVDEGRAKAADDLSPRVTDPAAVAAVDFAGRLAAHGVQVVGKPSATSGGSAAAGASELARVSSPRLADLVEHMLTVSDNDLAESLLRHVALADGKPATFQGGVAAVRDQLGKLDLNLAGLNVLDGSGLSHADRIAPEFLVKILSTAAADNHPDLRAALTGLPVAGFTGTLAEDGRYTTPPSLAGAGLVRAKTGSLTGVVTLAGLVRDNSGQLLVFALMADQAPDTAAARGAVDRLATALAGCGCGGAAAGG
ncbi:D-alanyl-D-alanine carboxypeptidase/D-alanyl-D-alanine endopeptidase [Catenulispora rubra]|uniref:D-alanyl-D-alanine carboxypeptidase/D-alanyl-D-alanine endopeptidase n=1 Tax=Catenulispora rubra TaxID=280293 RepID=UPI0018928882|nr:D-alanyl-D-alanine carboxypeptidase/D-alanyl-D-alanine-endopeptidase [Catenulispora rubra]